MPESSVAEDVFRDSADHPATLSSLSVRGGRKVSTTRPPSNRVGGREMSTIRAKT